MNYLMPGIFVQTVVFGALTTAVGLAGDLHLGIIERFKSLPIARSAVLTGRTTADLARNFFVMILMCVVGFAVGWRILSDVWGLLAAIGLILAFSYSLSWIFAFVGLSVKDAETAQAASFPILAPLIFASSAFIPVQTMPGWLQPWAEHQPVSVVCDAARDLTLGLPAGSNHAQGDRVDRRHRRRLRPPRRPQVPQDRLAIRRTTTGVTRPAMPWFVDASLRRERSQLGQAVEGERRLGDGADREADEQQRVVVARGAVEVELVAAGAPVDEQPFAVAPDRDAQRLHQGTAVGGAVAGRVVDVTAPQAERAVVAMPGALGLEQDAGAAMAAGERARVPVRARDRLRWSRDTGVPPKSAVTGTAPRVRRRAPALRRGSAHVAPGL